VNIYPERVDEFSPYWYKFKDSIAVEKGPFADDVAQFHSLKQDKPES
jgi:hypothetical protein